MKNYLLLLILLTLVSCKTQRFVSDASFKSTASTTSVEVPPNYSEWNHFIFWGIGQTKVVDPVDLCKNKSGVAYIEAKETFTSGLVTNLTFGIYSPRVYNIYCKQN